MGHDAGVADRLPAPSSARPPGRFRVPKLPFARRETFGAAVMLAAAVLALLVANSPWRDPYHDLWDTTVGIVVGDVDLGHLGDLTLRDWVNDGLMTLFFLVIALEVKRERTVGQLAEPRAALLPVVAAVGGMLVPVVIYLGFNAGTDGARGWGIPMATDIAFAVGVVALLGTRVPAGALAFLLALAVVDDLGSILVIAVVYTEDLAVAWLLATVVLYAAIFALRRLGVGSTWAYVVVGVLMWWTALESGIHPTIVGVALGLATPVTPATEPRRVARALRRLLDGLESDLPAHRDLRQVPPEVREQATGRLLELAHVGHGAVPPLFRLHDTLTPWSSFVVVPLFAFANAGVTLDPSRLLGLTADPVFLGVTLGLAIGKPVGIVLASWLTIRLGWASLPDATSWSQLIGIGIVAGIGFTVALFITGLSFGSGEMATSAKQGILVGSVVAGLVGYWWLRATAPAVEATVPSPPAADETR